MFDTNIQTLATDHANQLADKGIVVEPRPGTPLAELVAYCRSSETGLKTTEDFSVMIEGMADFLADQARLYSDFARNVVKPALAMIQERVSDGIKQINIDPFFGMDIVTVGAPAVLEDGDFLRSISHFNSGIVNVPNTNPRFGTRTTEQLIEMCLTGSADWDKSIKTWLAGLEEGQLQSVWQSVFQDKVNFPVTAPIHSLETLLKDYTKGKFSALIIFLMAHRFHQNIDDEIGVPLNEARQFLYALLQACAHNIENGINWFNSFVSTASLVANVDRTARKITVNAAVYKQFQAEGGKADVLMGMLVTGKTYSTIAEINAHADELLADWSRYTQARIADTEAAYENQVRELLLRAFVDALATPFGDVEAEMLNKPGVKDTAINIFKSELQGYTRGQLNHNWIDVLWRCACKGRFHYHSAVYPLLDAVDDGVRGKGMTPEDAHTMAMQQYVANFISEMIKAA